MSPVDASKPLPLLSFENIMAEPLAPVEWLVEGIIAKGDRVMVYGEFGAFKSWLLMHLGLHVAAGVHWLGKFSVPVARPVLYIDEEMHEQTLRRRVKRLGLGAGLEAQALPFRVASRVGVRFSLGGAKALLEALKKTDFQPDVIIVETFRRVLVGSENEAEDVAAFWREVEPLLAGDRTLIVSHHMRKPSQQGNNNPRHRASGSTDILAGSDSSYSVSRQTGDSVIVECHKLRAAEEGAPFIVSLYDEGPDSPVILRYEGAWNQERARKSKVEQAIDLTEMFLLASSDQRATTGAILAHLKGHGVKERTGESALKEMGERQLRRLGHGEYQLEDRPMRS